jgi:hypothetical protein
VEEKGGILIGRGSSDAQRLKRSRSWGSAKTDIMDFPIAHHFSRSFGIISRNLV